MLQIPTSIHIFGHVYSELQKAQQVCDSIVRQSEFESKDCHRQMKMNYLYIGLIPCTTYSWQGSSCGKLPRDRTVLSISEIHVSLKSRLLQIAIEDGRVVWVEWDGYNHAPSSGHFAACTDLLVTWRAYDWLVLATLVSGIVADRFDSRPYVSELQDFLMAVSVRFISLKSFFC
jgi:hypothetical protein